MENESTKKQRRFLVEWSMLNLFGWVIGFILVFIVAYSVFTLKHLAWKYGWAIDFRNEWTGEAALIWFPLGLGIGVLQWVKLRRLGIKLFIWAFLTALGCAILVSLYSWVYNSLGSVVYITKYSIPYWAVNLGIAITLPIGGAIIGGLQSLVIRKRGLKPNLWIKAYSFGLLLPPIITPLAILVKSYLLNLFYSFEFLWFLVDMRWFLFFGFLFFITALCISILTGKILLKQTNMDSITRNAG